MRDDNGRDDDGDGDGDDDGGGDNVGDIDGDGIRAGDGGVDDSGGDDVGDIDGDRVGDGGVDVGGGDDVGDIDGDGVRTGDSGVDDGGGDDVGDVDGDGVRSGDGGVGDGLENGMINDDGKGGDDSEGDGDSNSGGDGVDDGNDNVAIDDNDDTVGIGDCPDDCKDFEITDDVNDDVDDNWDHRDGHDDNDEDDKSAVTDFRALDCDEDDDAFVVADSFCGESCRNVDVAENTVKEEFKDEEFENAEDDGEYNGNDDDDVSFADTTADEKSPEPNNVIKIKSVSNGFAKIFGLEFITPVELSTQGIGLVFFVDNMNHFLRIANNGKSKWTIASSEYTKLVKSFNKTSVKSTRVLAISSFVGHGREYRGHFDMAFTTVPRKWNLLG